NERILAILFTTIISFLVGYIDDVRVMPGWFKPLALISAGIPIIVLGAHGNHLNLIFGDSFIPILYLPLILAIIPIAGNTMNSFLFLSSVKKIVEHRDVKSRPTVMTDDFKIMASRDKNAPSTLVRLIVVRGPLTEAEIVKRIFILVTFSSVLAFVSIMIQSF